MPKIQHDNITFDSQEEVDFYEWLKEAKDLKIVNSFEYKPCTYIIIPKQRISDKYSLREYNYTPDFKIQFNMTYAGKILIDLLKFFKILPDLHVDVKGTFSRFSDDTKFSITQKAMMFINGIWVAKIIPEKLFLKT